MIIPVRCFTCGSVLGDKWIPYITTVQEEKNKSNEEVDDDEPTTSQLKGDSVSKLGNKLQQTTAEMKRVVKKWKDAEGAEKAKLTDRLRELTKIKKEIESLLQ